MKLTITCKDGQTIEIDYTWAGFPEWIEADWIEREVSDMYRIEGEL